MPRVQVTFNKPWPLAGSVRKEGEILIEGISPIPGITADKIINAFRNGVVLVEISEPQAVEDEKVLDSHGIGSVFGKRSGKNKKP